MDVIAGAEGRTACHYGITALQARRAGASRRETRAGVNSEGDEMMGGPGPRPALNSAAVDADAWAGSTDLEIAADLKIGPDQHFSVPGPGANHFRDGDLRRSPEVNSLIRYQ